MPTDFALALDTKPAVTVLDRVGLGLQQRKKLHELLVIRAQQVVAKRFKGLGPALSSFTMLTRRGSAPLQDSGFFRLSLTGANPAQLGQSEGSLNAATDQEGVIGSKLVQAALLNYGGTVRATRARFLTLPATDEARRAGSARDFPRKLFFVKAKSGQAVGWLAERRGKGKAAELLRHYLGRESVTIPPRAVVPTGGEFQPDADKVGEFYLRTLVSGQAQQPGGV